MLFSCYVNLAGPQACHSLRMHWGLRLKEEREGRSLTQATVALWAGVTKSAVSQWESGGNIKPENLFAIADKLGVSARWLATAKGPRTNEGIQAESQLEQQLLDLYRQLPIEFQAMLLADANKYHTHAHPQTSAANPYGHTLEQPVKTA